MKILTTQGEAELRRQLAGASELIDVNSPAIMAGFADALEKLVNNHMPAQLIIPGHVTCSGLDIIVELEKHHFTAFCWGTE